MASVQFYGLDNVLTAAENLGCPAWAIFISPTLMFTKYQGVDMQESLAMLEKNLQALQDNNTAGTYTIKFYEAENGKPIKITQKSVCDGGAFNFKLMSGEERQANVINGSYQHGELSQMRKDIAELKTLMAAPEQEGEREETIGSIFMDLLKQPERLAALVNVGRYLLNMPPVHPVQGAAMGNIIPVDQINEQRIDDVERMGRAIDVLEKKDPNLVNHLERLAEMAQSKPEQFSMALSMLT